MRFLRALVNINHSPAKTNAKKARPTHISTPSDTLPPPPRTGTLGIAR
ncbi:Uncharacterised protein [Mycobacteroides abscessus subsp. abscessus]|nr:Uncharacterised protein [Mycobacteroides abscessus subsp. abscessus]